MKTVLEVYFKCYCVKGHILIKGNSEIPYSEARSQGNDPRVTISLENVVSDVFGAKYNNFCFV